MTALRLRLLGGFHFEHSGDRLDVPVGMQRLLAFLALRGHTHRSVVAGTLWPEVPESQALASLRTGVWRVNRLLPGLLLCEGPALSMAPSTSTDSADQERFALRLLREHVQDQQSVTDGLPTLWWGELLPGWYDDWVIFERERLNQLRLHALERCATLLADWRELDLALQLALEAVRAEPLRETANSVLMAVYLAEGNVADAVHQYHVFRTVLERELGLQPSRQLAQLLPHTVGSSSHA